MHAPDMAGSLNPRRAGSHNERKDRAAIFAFVCKAIRREREFEEKVFIRRVAEVQTPVIPLPCFRARRQ